MLRAVRLVLSIARPAGRVDIAVVVLKYLVVMEGGSIKKQMRNVPHPGSFAYMLKVLQQLRTYAEHRAWRIFSPAATLPLHEVKTSLDNTYRWKSDFSCLPFAARCCSHLSLSRLSPMSHTHSTAQPPTTGTCLMVVCPGFCSVCC